MNKSKRRDVVYEVLCSTKIHPTAEWIYEKSREILPSISRGTVYRNLKELISNGQLTKVEGVFEMDRYDADVETHSHLVCRECGAVVDFSPYDIKSVIHIGQLDGFCVDEFSLVYHGLCVECNKLSDVNKLA